MTPLLCALAATAAAADGAPPSALPYTREEAAVVFRVANEAFARDEVDTAMKGYQRLLAGGFDTEEVHYNLGTAHLRTGRLGPAILHLERALRLDPGHADARANLERAQKMRVDRLVGAPQEAEAEESLVARIASRTSADRFGWVFLALYGACAAALLGRRLLTAPGPRALLGVVALVAGVAALPAGAVAGVHAYVRERWHEAVVTAPVAPVKEGPAADAKAAFEVHEGLKVRILAEDSGHYRLRLANGLEGWTPTPAVTPL